MASDVVYDAILGALTLRQIVSGQYQPQANPIDGVATGAPDRSTLYGGKAEPKVMYQSADLAGILAAVSLTAGLPVSGGTITVPFQKRANLATFAAGSAHMTVSGTSGLAIISEISAGQDDDAAMASLETWFLSSNGIVNPVTIAVNQALGSQAYNAQFGLGPAYINGTLIPEVVRTRVIPGCTVVAERHNGSLYPDRLYLVQRRPAIELVFHDFDALNALSSYAVMTSCAVYYRRRSGVGYVANATTSHARFSFTDGLIQVDQAGGQGVGSGEAALRLHGLALAGTTAVAIP